MHHATSLFFALLFSTFLCTCVRAQKAAPESFFVSGQVFGTDGETMIGATVHVPKTTHGTVADRNGFFELRVYPGQSLEVSYLGYERACAGTPLSGLTSEHPLSRSRCSLQTPEA